MDYGKIVSAINFGAAPFEPAVRDNLGRASGGPLNRRAEMWMKSKEWLADPAGALAKPCPHDRRVAAASDSSERGHAAPSTRPRRTILRAGATRQSPG